MALHFVGFKDDRYWKAEPSYVRAVEIFGKPAPGDTVVWANYGEGLAACLPPFLHHTFDDSREDIIANGGKKGVDYL